MKASVIIFFLLLGVCPVYSQNAPVCQVLTTADGLSDDFVYDILQSRDGFIWIATENGLNRYDGARFEVFLQDALNPFAISNNSVFRLFEDSRGWIWMELTDGSIDVMDPVSKYFFHVLRKDKKYTDADFRGGHTGFLETPDGAVWFAGSEGIVKFNLQKAMLEKAIQQDDAYIEPLCKKVIPLAAQNDQSGEALELQFLFFTQHQKLLVGTHRGLWALDLRSEKLSLIGMPDASISWIGQDPAGRIWMNHHSYDPSLQPWMHLLKPSTSTTVWDEKAGIQQARTINGCLNDITFDNAGALWGWKGETLKKIQTQRLLNNESAEMELSFDSLFAMPEVYGAFTALLLDHSGVLWVGSYHFGIARIIRQPPVFYRYFSDVDINSIIASPDGKFMVQERRRTGKYESIRSFDPKEPFPYQILPITDEHGVALDRSDRFSDMQFDQAGNSWYRPDYQYVLRKDAQTGQVQKIDFKGFELCFDAKGRLLSFDSTGLVVFDPQTAQSQYFDFKKTGINIAKIDPNDYHAFWKDAGGVIWILGPNGLMKALSSGDGYRFEYFVHHRKDYSSLSSDRVLCVAEDPIDPDRFLWVGTEGGGLNRFDKQSEKFIQYASEQGLQSNTVYGILAENHKPLIWLSTDKGLCRFDIVAKTFTNFTDADGLPYGPFNTRSYLKMRDGTMVFGGVSGLTVFHPDSLRLNTHAPQIRIVGFRVNNRPFDFAGDTDISLSRDENLIAFDFAALEFTNPAQNQYRYQLVGVDKEWVFLGTKNSIQFVALAPGTYTFKVMGCNNHGVWSEQPAVLKFTIRPPWWASWWAYLIYLALAAAGIWGYYQYLLRQRFSEQEKLRLQELDDFKSRFFTNITHEFRTPLTVILGMSEQVLSDKVTQSHPATIAQPIGLIKRNGENLLRLINQILDLSKLESNTLKMNFIQGDVLGFVKYIAESMHSLANAQNLMLLVESDQTKIVMDYDPERFLQIIHNLLSNAIKFTPSGGKVILRVTTTTPEGPETLPMLNISVTDTGAGIPPEELPHLFERFFQARNQEHAKTGGAGIGLSLTRELVKAMGGKISVDSKVGAGSTFLVKLPITNNSAFDEKVSENWKVPATSRPSASAPVGIDEDRPNILIIEDNPDVVEYLSACLQGAGDRKGRPYHLDFAYNGQAGIDHALENVPDLIVSDVMMPFKDGFEVVETLKNDERSSHIPIILLTAKADVQSRLAGLRRGADAYLSKPFHQEELLVTVENLLEIRRKLQSKYQQELLVTEIVTPVATPADPEDAFLQNVRAIIAANYASEDFGLPQLCQKIGMSRSQLFRKMKALTDIAPSDLIRVYRLNKAKSLLESGTVNVAEAAWQVGFKDPSYFSKLYQEEFGVLPSATNK